MRQIDVGVLAFAALTRVEHEHEQFGLIGETTAEPQLPGGFHAPIHEPHVGIGDGLPCGNRKLSGIRHRPDCGFLIDS